MHKTDCFPLGALPLPQWSMLAEILLNVSFWPKRSVSRLNAPLTRIVGTSGHIIIVIS